LYNTNSSISFVPAAVGFGSFFWVTVVWNPWGICRRIDTSQTEGRRNCCGVGEN